MNTHILDLLVFIGGLVTGLIKAELDKRKQRTEYYNLLVDDMRAMQKALKDDISHLRAELEDERRINRNLSALVQVHLNASGLELLPLPFRLLSHNGGMPTVLYANNTYTELFKNDPDEAIPLAGMREELAGGAVVVSRVAELETTAGRRSFVVIKACLMRTGTSTIITGSIFIPLSMLPAELRQ